MLGSNPELLRLRPDCDFGQNFATSARIVATSARIVATSARTVATSARTVVTSARIVATSASTVATSEDLVDAFSHSLSLALLRFELL